LRERMPRVLKEPEAKRRRPCSRRRAAASRSATTARRSGEGVEMPEGAKKPARLVPTVYVSGRLDGGGPRSRVGNALGLPFRFA
jgi:hypothetical protein